MPADGNLNTEACLQLIDVSTKAIIVLPDCLPQRYVVVDTRSGKQEWSLHIINVVSHHYELDRPSVWCCTRLCMALIAWAQQGKMYGYLVRGMPSYGGI
jgi:hypothetical protein